MPNRWAAGFVCILSWEQAEFAQGSPCSPNVRWCKAVGGIAYGMQWKTVSCSSWGCPVYPAGLVCGGLHWCPSFLAFDMRESCSHDYKQRGSSRCCSSCLSWHESSDQSPAHFGCWMLVSVFGACRAGIAAAAEGSAPPDQRVEGEPTSPVNRHWRRQKEKKSLGRVAMIYRKITAIS